MNHYKVPMVADADGAGWKVLKSISSQPGPDRSIRMADLKKDRFVSRRYRNRRIGEFLKELSLTEGRGTGIPKIMRAIRHNKSPRPKFETKEF